MDRERLMFLNELVPAEKVIASQGRWKLKGAIETRQGIVDFEGEVELSRDNSAVGQLVLSAMLNARKTAKLGADTVRFRGTAALRKATPPPTPPEEVKP